MTDEKPAASTWKDVVVEVATPAVLFLLRWVVGSLARAHGAADRTKARWER